MTPDKEKTFNNNTIYAVTIMLAIITTYKKLIIIHKNFELRTLAQYLV